MILTREFLLSKYLINENRLAVTTAALGLAGGAMAMPPSEDIPYIDKVLQGIGNAEHRGRITGSTLDYNPKLYVRTGGPDPILNKGVDPSKQKQSSAYGPYQWTTTTIRNLRNTQPELFAGTEEYVDKFIAQGQKMLKNPNDPVYGYRKSGVLGGEENHAGYVNMSRAGLAAMAKNLKIDLKTMTPEQEMSLVKAYRGVEPEKAYKNAYYAGKELERKTTVPLPETKPAVSSKSTPASPSSPSTGQTPTRSKPVAPVTAPTSTPSSYIVVKGDNLSTIAKKHGKTLSDMIKSNPQLANPNLINPGDKVNIPE